MGGVNSRMCSGIFTETHPDPLMQAVITGDHDALVSLMDVIQVNRVHQGNSGEWCRHLGSETPLMAASIRGDSTTVSLLLETGLVELEKQNSEGITALAAVATVSSPTASHLSVMEALLSAKASVHTRDHKGRDALARCCACVDAHEVAIHPVSTP